MSDFNANMHQILLSAGDLQQTPLGSLQRSSRPPVYLRWPTSKGRGRKGRAGQVREGKVKGMEGKANFGVPYSPPVPYPARPGRISSNNIDFRTLHQKAYSLENEHSNNNVIILV